VCGTFNDMVFMLSANEVGEYGYCDPPKVNEPDGWKAVPWKDCKEWSDNQCVDLEEIDRNLPSCELPHLRRTQTRCPDVLHVKDSSYLEF